MNASSSVSPDRYWQVSLTPAHTPATLTLSPHNAQDPRGSDPKNQRKTDLDIGLLQRKAAQETGSFINQSVDGAQSLNSRQHLANRRPSSYHYPVGLKTLSSSSVHSYPNHGGLYVREETPFWYCLKRRGSNLSSSPGTMGSCFRASSSTRPSLSRSSAYSALLILPPANDGKQVLKSAWPIRTALSSSRYVSTVHILQDIVLHTSYENHSLCTMAHLM